MDSENEAGAEVRPGYCLQEQVAQRQSAPHAQLQTEHVQEPPQQQVGAAWLDARVELEEFGIVFSSMG